MRLFQPSGIVPSSFAGDGGGVADAYADAVVTWQLNGNARLWQYTITILDETGSVTKDTFTHTYDPSVPGNEPLYTTDAGGNPVTVTAALGGTWTLHNVQNGNTYRLRITQYYKAEESDETLTELVPDSDAVFTAKAAPTLSIDAFTDPLPSVSQTFTAAYGQAQGTAARWVRWVLFNDTDGITETDTGEVFTQVFSFSYDGFFNGKDYTLRCEACTSDGVTVSDSVSFSCEYEGTETYGALNAARTEEEAVSLSWMPGRNVPGTAEGSATVSGGSLTLAAGASVSWDEVNGEAMSFPAPLSVAWRGLIGDRTSETGTVTSGEYTLDKTYTEEVTETATVAVPCQTEHNQYGSSQVKASGRIYYNEEEAAYEGDVTLSVASGDIFLYVQSASAYEGYETISYGSVPVTHVQADGTSITVSLRLDVDIAPAGSYKPVIVTVTYWRAIRDGYEGILAYSPENLGASDVIRSVTVKSTSADRASASVADAPTPNGTPSGRNILVRVYDADAASAYYVVLEYVVLKTRTGADSYRSIVSSSAWPGATAAAVTSVTAGTTASVSVSGGVVTVTFQNATGEEASASLLIYTLSHADRPALLSLNEGDVVLSEDEGGTLLLTISGSEAASAEIPASASEASVTIGGGVFSSAFFSVSGEVIGRAESALSAEIPTIVSISTAAPDDLTQTVDYIVLTSGEGAAAPEVRPSYGSGTLFYASFLSGLNAGSAAASGSFLTAIYRSDGKSLVRIGAFPNTVLSVKDWGVVSGVSYTYRMYYVLNGAASFVSESDPICITFRAVSLLEAEETENGYSVVTNRWRFGNNLGQMPISDGYSPSFLTNFTKYPLYQPSSQAGKSGTLTALLSNFSSGRYEDTAEEMDALFAVSLSVNPFYLRDLKGNIYKVRPGGAITQTVNHENGPRAVSVSVPWREDGEAAGVSLVSFD